MTDTVAAPAGSEARTGYRTKLIEVALPLEAINAASAREKSIRHGHPSTLHLWWARRPLAACRAVLFAQLVDDPSAVPEEFPTEDAQEEERQRMFRIIEELVKWENSTNEAVLTAARREIARSVARTAGVPGPETDADTRRILREHAPPVLDPFCGGGSIPLEAQRLGLEAHASDLNPVAVLITKALIEIPPKFAGMPPVNPRDRNRGMGAAWKGAAGLAADVRYYGEWMREEAFKRIGHLYPKATLPDGSEATVIAWLWARTVTCPNPACGAQMPLVRSFALSTKKGKETWVEPVVDHEAKAVRFEVRSGKGVAPRGTIDRKGARCVVCETFVPFEYIRQEGTGGHMGQSLIAVAVSSSAGRAYLSPTKEQETAAQAVDPVWEPTTDLPKQALGFRVQRYGLTHHRDLFTPRQLNALSVASGLVAEAHGRILLDVGQDRDAEEYAAAVALYLGEGVSKLATFHNTLAYWRPEADKSSRGFDLQVISMVWAFAEVNPFAGAGGDFLEIISTAPPRVILGLPAAPRAYADQADAASQDGTEKAVHSTDPPYYDNVGYADLSDFFYVWLRHALRPIYPELFATVLVPKAQELVANPFRFAGNREEARMAFEDGLSQSFALMQVAQDPALPMTIYYAFKQSESVERGGIDTSVSSTGWEAMLESLVRAGLAVVATWPVRTESGTRMRAKSEGGSNALASSIVLTCRRRPADAATATRRQFISALREELPPALTHLTHGNIAPVDLAQAAIGPGMRVFSRYARVIESDGTPMTVRTALGLINQVLYEVEAESESEYDPDTRWAVTWFEQFGMAEGPYGDAETLSKAKDTSVGGLQEAGIVHARSGKVRLLRREELDAGWDPATDRRLTVWEVTQHLIRALDDSEGTAAGLLRRVGGLGDAARDLAYALYLVADRKKWTEEAMAYNGLVVAWPEISKLAAASGSEQAGLGLE